MSGKKRNDHTLPQEEINELLVRLAKEGKRVLRLKGGDPFIFGRGGEEIETLAGQGHPVPGRARHHRGIRRGFYAGIPLTHRDHAQSCIFVTGHLKDGTMNLDWEALARPKQTIVVYMGLHGLDTFCAELVKHGMPAQYSDRDRAAGHDTESARRHRHACDAAAKAESRRIACADFDHRRRRRHAEGKTGLVPP